MAYGVQDCETLLRTIAVDSDDRTGDGRTVHEVGCAPVKLRMSSGRGKDAQSVLPKALCLRPYPVKLLLRSFTFAKIQKK